MFTYFKFSFEEATSVFICRVIQSSSIILKEALREIIGTEHAITIFFRSAELRRLYVDVVLYYCNCLAGAPHGDLVKIRIAEADLPEMEGVLTLVRSLTIPHHKNRKVLKK
jgi:hypothetical protein